MSHSPPTPPPQQQRAKRSQKHGPAVFIHTEDKSTVMKIPLGKNSSLVDEAEMDATKTPPAWRIETMHGIHKRPNKANYYRKFFTNAFYRRHAWQFMFGGLLRAVFGIYAPARYWNREFEQALQEDMREDYEQTKAKGYYGIYVVQLVKNFSFSGAKWKHGQPPRGWSTTFRRWPINMKKGSKLTIRVDRLHERPYVDLELHSIYTTNVWRIPWPLFELRFKQGFFRQIRSSGSKIDGQS